MSTPQTGTLRAVPFKEIYEQIVSKLGLDPSLPVPHNLWQAIPRNVNKRLRTAWTYWEWPYLEQCDERAFARTWLSDHQFVAGEAVIYVADLHYYRVLEDATPPIGTLPTDTLYWEPLEDCGNFIAFDQECRRPMGMVLGVYPSDPRNNGCGCGGREFRPVGNGITCGGGGPTVFVKYQLPVPRFSLTPYAPGRAYVTGNLVYHDGECYIAVAASAGVAPPATSAWLRQSFPAVFEDYVVAAAYASCLKEQSQAQEGGDSAQMRMMWARDAEAEAEEALVQEIDKLKAMGQRFHYRSWKQCAHTMCRPPGVCISEPFTGDTPGFEPPVTTLKEICETDPTASAPPPVPPVDEPDILVNTQTGIMQLVNGQSYIDVVFAEHQPTSTWTFIECQIVNTLDSGALNIWPGIVTSRNRAGFRLQLNGIPDTANYYLHWTIAGPNAGAGEATTYVLLGPATGPLDAPSTFAVSLPAGTTASDPVTVTPGDGGDGGTFIPTSVTLTTDAPSATFSYTPDSYGAKTISVTNEVGLIDPAPVTIAAIAATYTLIGPSTGAISVPSTNFTVALPVGAPVVGTMTVTPNDGGAGGTFTPTTVALTTAAPSATFTYTPASYGDKTISVTNNKGLTNPTALVYAVPSPYHLLNTLISYWKLDEASGTRNDSHGTNHLAAAGSPVGATGKINNGCQFVSASSQYLAILDNSSLRVTSDFTWSLWVKFTSVAANQSLVTKDDGVTTGNRDYSISYHATSGFVFSVKDLALYAVAVGSPVSAGVWIHVLAWYDSSDQKMRLRINDATTYASSMTSTLTQTICHLRIGAFVEGAPTGFTDSIIDEIGFWKRKLTAGEITQLYNGGAGLPYSSFTA